MHPRQRAFLGAVATGFLGGGAFPPLSLTATVWVALTPLLLALDGAGIRQAFALGLVAGLVGFFTAWGWAWEAAPLSMNVSWFVGAAFAIVLVLWHAVEVGLFAMVLRLSVFRSAGILVIPAAWVALETVYPRVFSWSMGRALQPHETFIQIAAYTGISGLSFAVLLVSALCARSWTRRQSGRRWIPPLVLAACVVLVLHLFGRWEIERLREHHSERSATVAIVQADVPVVWEASDAYVRESFAAHARLTRSVASRDPDLVIWSEAALRTRLMRDPEMRNALLRLAEEVETSILAGARWESPSGREISSAFLASPFGTFTGSYGKSRLVPFVERLPPWLAFLRPWWPVPGVAPAPPGHVMLLPGIRFAPSICYEATFPAFFRDMVREDAELLVNITNDAWFGNRGGPEQHLIAAAMRAVESRRWMARAANSGVSALIAPTGKVVARTALFEPAVLVGEIELRRGESFYLRHGEWFPMLCGALLVVAGAYGAYRSHRSRQRSDGGLRCE